MDNAGNLLMFLVIPYLATVKRRSLSIALLLVAIAIGYITGALAHFGTPRSAYEFENDPTANKPQQQQQQQQQQNETNCGFNKVQNVF